MPSEQESGASEAVGLYRSVSEWVRSAVFRRPWVTAAVFVGVAVATFYWLPDPTPSPVRGACAAELGSQWENAGYIGAPSLEHYDVQCTRSTGIFGSEEEWITLEKSYNASK